MSVPAHKRRSPSRLLSLSQAAVTTDEVGRLLQQMHCRDRYQALALLTMLQGTGGFGDVFEAEWRGRRVAVKKLPQLAAGARDGPSPEAQYAALIAEIQLSCRFNSSRLVSGRTCIGMLYDSECASTKCRVQSCCITVR